MEFELYLLKLNPPLFNILMLHLDGSLGCSIYLNKMCRTFGCICVWLVFVKVVHSSEYIINKYISIDNAAWYKYRDEFTT